MIARVGGVGRENRFPSPPGGFRACYPPPMTAISLQGITKRYGDVLAVNDIDLEINSGELFFLLGPSGCGKTTLLRMIAGFIAPTAGSIRFGARDVTKAPPNKRNTGMVFQSYALWPHMTVADNVGYGLKLRKVDATGRAERVQRALEMVRMGPYGRRKPNELSGGQQQRVALARALVVEPEVLLLDEPLSNLDAKLRLEMREEIRRICSETEITTVYVTHDQKEALSLADRVAVLDMGVVAQVGPPRGLYQRPSSRFVADFLGETNFLHADVKGVDNGRATLETASGTLTSTAFDETLPKAGSVTCSIRPEALTAAPANGATNVLTGVRRSVVYLGEIAQHVIELEDGAELRTLEMNPHAPGASGETVRLTVDPDDVVVLGD